MRSLAEVRRESAHVRLQNTYGVVPAGHVAGVCPGHPSKRARFPGRMAHPAGCSHPVWLSGAGRVRRYAYFDRRFFWVVFGILGVQAGVDDNLRRASKRKLTGRLFLRQWQRQVIQSRTDIERYFAWIKRYFGLK